MVCSHGWPTGFFADPLARRFELLVGRGQTWAPPPRYATAPTLSNVPTVYRVPDSDEFSARDLRARDSISSANWRSEKTSAPKNTKGRAKGTWPSARPFHTPRSAEVGLLRTYLKIADCCRSDNNVE